MKTIKFIGSSAFLKILVPCFITFLFSSAVPIQDKPQLRPTVIKMVRICHDGETMMIPESQLNEHLNHGDKIGYCAGIVKPEDLPGPLYKPQVH